MPSIKSDISNKTLPGGTKLREFEVPDESGYAPLPSSIDPSALMSDQSVRPSPASFGSNRFRGQSLQDLHEREQLLEEARQRESGKERLSAAAKKRIELLCGTSRLVREVSIDGNNYVLRTLKGKEQRAAIMAATAFDNTVESPFEIRRQLLARSLTEIAGTDIELFLGDSSLEARLDLIEELDDSVLAKLYDEYLALIREARERYYPKTEAEVKEVVEDLKK